MEDIGDGVDTAVDRGFNESCIGRVSGLVAKEVVDTNVYASSGFGQVVGVIVEHQDHVTGYVDDGGVGVGCSIIEEPNGCATDFLRCFIFLGRNGANGNEQGGVDGYSVVA